MTHQNSKKKKKSTIYCINLISLKDMMAILFEIELSIFLKFFNTRKLIGSQGTELLKVKYIEMIL